MRIICAALALILAWLSSHVADIARAQEKMTLASSGAGSAVGLLSEVIKKNRLDERNGLALDVRYFDPAAAEQAVRLRRADVGIFPVISAARANLTGEKIRIFAPALVNHNSVIAQKESTAERLADLKGKAIGTLDRISMTYTTLATIARMQGLDLERDFKLTLAPPPALMGLFERGDLDALVIFEPLVTRLVTDGYRQILRLDDAWKKETGEPMVGLGMGAHEDWIKSHTAAAKKFIQTIVDGVGIIHKNPRAVVEENKEFLGVKTDRQIARLAIVMPEYYVARWDRRLVQNMTLLLKKNVEMGLIKEMPKDEIFVVLD